jgi:Arc/MetJ-type ribon-helix-helix transcriptional regulator
MRTTKSVTISLPREQLKTAKRLAKKQRRTMSELFREALRRLEQEEEWRPSPVALAQFGKLVRSVQQEARHAGLDKISLREINAEVEAVRKERRQSPRQAVDRAGK